MTSSPRRQVVRFVSPSSPSSTSEVQTHLVEPNITSNNDNNNNKRKLRLPQTLPDLDCSKHEKCVANKGQTIMTTITMSMTAVVTTGSVPGLVLRVGRLAVILCILSVLTNIGFESLRVGGSADATSNISWMSFLSGSKLLRDDTNFLTTTSIPNLRHHPVVAATNSTDGNDDSSDDDDALALAQKNSKKSLKESAPNMTMNTPTNITTEGNDGDEDQTSVAAATAVTPMAAINDDSRLRLSNATTNPSRPVSVSKIGVPKDTTTPKTTSTMMTHVAATDKNNDSEESEVAKALAFVAGRRHAYMEQGFDKEWTLRGIGYLYTHHHISLMAHVPQSHDRVAKQVESGGGHGNNNKSVIRIVNVHPNKTITDENNSNYCDLLTIWVRVNGPEIFAGRAQAVSIAKGSSCYWEFPFDLQIQGNYTVDAKVLVWNGLAPIGGNDRSQCEFTKGNINRTALHELYPIHTGFVGYKLHYPQKSCCEICTKLAPHCRYWTSPPSGIPNPTYAVNGCELYFNQDVGDLDNIIPRSRLLQNITRLYGGRKRRKRDGKRPAVEYHGKPHTNSTSYFVGCGWDNWFTLDYPCLSGELDDRVYTTSGGTFVFSPSPIPKLNDISSLGATGISKDDQTHKIATLQSLPLCTLENESLNVSKGRWVREPWPDATDSESNNTTAVCPTPMQADQVFGNKFDIMEHDGNHPHCWHRDDLSRIGHYCGEWNCQFLEPQSKWISDLHEETKWFGVWRQYGCDYLEFTDTQLQQCITDRKIASIETTGNSIARFMKEYFGLRLKNIRMYDGGGRNSSDSDAGIDVKIDTLTLVALSMNPDDHYFGLKRKLLKMPSMNVLQDEPSPNKATRRAEHYWVTGFFLSSEREPHIQAARIEKFNHIAADALGPKGYKMINAFDMSAAFAYDTATQFDGLHLIGPPMKMIVTKLFHHMCAGSGVEGSRL